MIQTVNRLISVASAAAQLGVSTFTVRRLMKAGHLPSVKISRRVLIPQDQVDKACQDGCGQAAAPCRRYEDRPATRAVVEQTSKRRGGRSQ